MVGWDVADEIALEEDNVEGKAKRKASDESLQSASSGVMSSIAETCACQRAAKNKNKRWKSTYSALSLDSPIT